MYDMLYGAKSRTFNYIMESLSTPKGQVPSIWRKTMEAITASNFRSSLASYLDKVTNNHEPVMVTRGDKQKAAVILSRDDYESLKETLYLLSSRANAQRMFSSLAKIKAGDVFERELIDENNESIMD